MYTMLISLAACMAVSLALQFGAGLNPWIAMLCGLAVFVVIFLLVSRQMIKKINAFMETAQRDIQAGRTEKAIATLKAGYRYAPWQFYMKEQINSQIGTILYLKRDFTAAFDYLDKGFSRHWVGVGMLAVCYMRKNNVAKMIKTFDKGVIANRKEDLLWNLYAFCLDKVGEHQKAIEVLEKGMKKATDTSVIAENIEALREGKRVKMKAYGDLWFQFHLEKPGAVIKQQTKAIQGRRKIVRR